MADAKKTPTKRRPRADATKTKTHDTGTQNTVVENVNEAYVEETPKVAPRTRAQSKKPTGPVFYESREKEPKMFDVAGINSTRNFSNGHLEWEVPVDDVERFEANHFFVRGRIRRKG